MSKNHPNESETHVRIINDPADVDMSTCTPGFKGFIVNVDAPSGSAIIIDGTTVDTSPRTLNEVEREVAAWKETFRALDARRSIPRLVRR